MAQPPIYLDYQATTPLAPEARAAMLPWLDAVGSANPHSAHVAGRAAKAAVELAREQVAALMPPGGQLYFTSGATEALNWALRCAGDGKRGIAAIATEHAAVLDTVAALAAQGRPTMTLAVDRSGVLADPVPDDVGLIAAMQVNNEIGTIQPVDTIAEAAHRNGALLLCDAVQGFGKLPVPRQADLIAVSAHKLHGPKGIGALWVRDGVAITPFITGGGQEGGLRSGTLSPALCAGFGAAAALAHSSMASDAAHVERLWDVAIKALGDGWIVNGSVTARYRGNLNVRRAGLDAGRLLSGLRDVAISAGSACASGSGRPSHVLSAIGLDASEARSSLRIGFGRYTTEDELRHAMARINQLAGEQ